MGERKDKYPHDFPWWQWAIWYAVVLGGAALGVWLWSSP